MTVKHETTPSGVGARLTNGSTGRAAPIDPEELGLVGI